VEHLWGYISFFRFHVTHPDIRLRTNAIIERMLTTKRILACGRILKKVRFELEKAEEYDRDLFKKVGLEYDRSNG
jgi:hypothetical protein